MALLSFRGRRAIPVALPGLYWLDRFVPSSAQGRGAGGVPANSAVAEDEKS